MTKKRIFWLTIILAGAILYYSTENNFTDFLKGLLAGITIAIFIKQVREKRKIASHQ